MHPITATLIIAALFACGLSAKDKKKDAAPTVFTMSHEEELELSNLKLEGRVLMLQLELARQPLNAKLNDYAERVKKAHPEFKDLYLDFQTLTWRTAPEPKETPTPKKTN